MTAQLPPQLIDGLLERWSEPHRAYHSTTHLVAGLQALDILGGQPLERIAFWFHDAVHTNTTPADEEASARLAGELLATHLPAPDVLEVQRLIMLTTHHQPDPEDLPGARLCDADLSGMGSEWDQYVDNIAGLRAEFPQLTTDQWAVGRSRFLVRFMQRDWLFSTWQGRHLWEDQARSNMIRELACLN
ncbi:metal-dependent phosphohydrolase [Tessaracoccus sp. OS52]|uniref:HD domain-containing protein n=1 Tax=Tessaracoccus sp. OS52 TaxID=2886691 RepID=UPI001D123F57|nr:metal-dependent phosphohydrolase [Tessaracoccus sp. OS52]MCC2594622.1 metal-dependent phosphohydrolase [Tessaracoccus sp. OS52]